MEKASAELAFETAALYRDRLAALVGDPVAAGHQSAHRRGSRRVRHPSGGRLFLRRGVLLPHRTELGQPRLFSARGKILHAGRGAGLVPRAVLRRQAAAETDPAVARDRGKRTAGQRALDQGRLQGRSLDAAARRKEGTDRARADQCARGARPQACRYRDPGPAAAGPGHHARPAASAEADRGLRQQPHPGHQRGRRHDRGRAGRLHQKPVPQVQHQVRRPDAGRRLRDDARGAAAALQAAVDAAGEGDAAKPSPTTIRFRNGPISSSSTAAAASSMRSGRFSRGWG